MDFSWIDIMILAILAICMIKGFIDGLIKSFLGAFVVIASLIGAKLLSSPVVTFIKEKTDIYNKLSESISSKMASVFQGSASSDAWTESSQLHNIPEALKKFISSFIDTTNNTVGTASEAFGENAANFILGAAVFIALVVILFIIGRLIVYLLDKFAELPVIKQFNKAGGVLVGLLKGAIFCILICTSVYYINLFLNNGALSTAINNSVLIKYFYISTLFGFLGGSN